jgi:hypothetical protein
MFGKIMKKIISIIIIGFLFFVSCGAGIYIGTNTMNYDLIIIAPDKFIPSLQSLVGHKNSHGIKTLIKNVDEIYKQFEGRDDAEKIKYYIKYAHEELNTQYVLLFGGRKSQSAVEDWWVPVRYVNIEFVAPDGRGEKRYISDLYYADIYSQNGSFSSWDTNNDGVFSEWPYKAEAMDIMELSPDVLVGRIPCRTVCEVKAIVRKIISYENESCDESWFKNIVGISFTSDLVMPEWDGESVIRQGLTYMQNFTHTTLFASDGSLKSSKDVIKAINRGCSFLWFFGGGTPKAWGVYLPNQTKWTFVLRNYQILLLMNREKLFICLDGSGCHNCLINVSIGNTLDFRPWKSKNWVMTATARCMCERLLTKRNGGCIAFIGPTAMGHDSFGISSHMGGCDWLDVQLLKEYNVNNVTILGEAWSNCLCNYVQNNTIDWNDTTSLDDCLIVKAAQAWSLFGDPSLKIGGY